MTETLFSTYWYRVANLKPMLRDTAVISRHIYRGEPWYVLRNSLSGRNHRFTTRQISNEPFRVELAKTDVVDFHALIMAIDYEAFPGKF